MEQTDLLRTGTASEANQSGLYQTGCGLNGTDRHYAERRLIWFGPDWTGPDRTGPDWTGLDRPAAWSGMDQCYVEL